MEFGSCRGGFETRPHPGNHKVLQGLLPLDRDALTCLGEVRHFRCSPGVLDDLFAQGRDQHRCPPKLDPIGQGPYRVRAVAQQVPVDQQAKAGGTVATANLGVRPARPGRGLGPIHLAVGGRQLDLDQLGLTHPARNYAEAAPRSSSKTRSKTPLLAQRFIRAETVGHLPPCSATYRMAFSTWRLERRTLPRWTGKQWAMRWYCASVIPFRQSSAHCPRSVNTPWYETRGQIKEDAGCSLVLSGEAWIVWPARYLRTRNRQAHVRTQVWPYSRLSDWLSLRLPP